MIQLRKDGVANFADVSALQEEFLRTRTFRIPKLIQDDLLNSMLGRLDRCTWTVMEHKKVGVEASPQDSVLVYALNFLANRPEFLESARKITGLSAIKAFKGRIYRLADSTHYDSWHTDCVGERFIGMSINLGRVPYLGGLFRLRARGSGEILCELPNTGPGDAIFFEISEQLEHMVTAVEGAVPKTAFAGWFVGSDWDYYRDVRRIPVALASLTSRSVSEDASAS